MKVRCVLYACQMDGHDKFYMIEQDGLSDGCGCTIRYGRVGQLASCIGFRTNKTANGLLAMLDKKMRGWKKKPYDYVEVFDKYEEQETHMVRAISWANGEWEDGMYSDPVCQPVLAVAGTWYNNGRP